MKVVFVHQNCPGQYKHLAPHLAADAANEVVFITKRGKPDVPGVRKVEYEPTRKPRRNGHPYLRLFEDGVLHGQGAARVAMELRQKGFYPDIVCAHMGWGEALFLKDVWPDARLLGYFEYYYHAFGSDADFAREEPMTLDDVARVRIRNALHLLNLEAADWGITPTDWQWRQHPREFRDKVSVIHDGVATGRLMPDPKALGRFKNGVTMRQGDEIVTYVARNLEPYRGFPTFMKAAELILRRRPQARIVVIGGDDVSYGRRPKDGGNWRETMLEQVDVDPSRIHFLGRIPYERYVRVLQLSAVHVYLTVPFVLSWSMLEAMSAECLVVASRTAPVEEVIEDGKNGLLVDFFSPDEIADRVDEVLDHPDRMSALRRRARTSIEERYSLDACLPRHVKLVETIAAGRSPLSLVTATRPKTSSKPAPARRPSRRRRARR